MVYYPQGMELEVVSELFCGKVNDAVVCRDKLSASGELYTLLVIRDRECALKLLGILENNERGGEPVHIMNFAQNDELIFVFPYREERKFKTFAKGQISDELASEKIAINLVMECLSATMPWPLLHLILEQELVNITKENTVYFTMNIDLEKLDEKCDEKTCVSDCIWMITEILDTPPVGKKKSKKVARSFELIQKKSTNGAYTTFPELYQDIRVTARSARKLSLKKGFRGFWERNKDGLFRFLLIICIILVAVALLMLLTQMIFGDIPWLRFFKNTFDVIGTQNLHQGVGI